MTQKTKVGKEVEKREPLNTVGGNGNWCNHYGKQNGESSKKLKIELPCDQAVPPLGIYQSKNINLKWYMNLLNLKHKFWFSENGLLGPLLNVPVLEHLMEIAVSIKKSFLTREIWKQRQLLAITFSTLVKAIYVLCCWLFCSKNCHQWTMLSILSTFRNYAYSKRRQECSYVFEYISV